MFINSFCRKNFDPFSAKRITLNSNLKLKT